MVSKVAVIALVGILAVPILLGYGLNLNEVSETEYKAEGDSVDVSQLLWNSTAYSYTYVDPYQLNTNTQWFGGNPSIPIFNSYTTNKTSYPLYSRSYVNQSWNNAVQSLNYIYFYEQFDYDPAVSSHSLTLFYNLNGTETVLTTITNVHSIYYDQVKQEYSYTKYTGSGYSITYGSGSAELTNGVLYTSYGSADVYIARYGTSTYADLSAGFYFKGTFSNYALYPANSKDALFTINLDSITAPNYSVNLIKTGAANNFRLVKTTAGSDVSWKVYRAADSTELFDLYYDPSRNDNSYQIYIGLEKTGQHSETQYGTTTVFNDYNITTEFRYVGGWPTIIGEANYYQKYTDTVSRSVAVNSSQPKVFLGFGSLTGYTDRSPTMRIDGGAYGSMEFNVIENKEYNPADFKTNPSTTITDIRLYGSSLTFAGNTYDVMNGNITLGTHQVSVSSCVFDSVPIYGGYYENRINGNVISTSAAPSTIKFNGAWLGNVVTDSMVSTTVIKTEWNAGQFAWDGIDQNFLIVGLITSLGAFIGLAIYSRRSRTSLLPLLLVCGGAAMLFLFML